MPVRGQQRRGREALACCERMRFGQIAVTRYQQGRADQREKPKICAPAKPGLQPATNDGRNRRRNREDHHHPRHLSLCFHPLIGIAHHRAAERGARTGYQPLQRAAHQQHGHTRRQRAADGGDNVAA